MYTSVIENMRKNCKISLVLLTAGLGAFAVGCSEKDADIASGIPEEYEEVVGEYEGDSGSVLEIKEDGTCYYKSCYDYEGVFPVEGEGSWYIEEDTIYIEASSIDGILYGEIGEEEGMKLLAEGEELEEFFAKVK